MNGNNERTTYVERARVGERILIAEKGSTGCVALPANEVKQLMRDLEGVVRDD